jgi:DNA-directed RNA polymerase specialized sigma24 family protein
MPDAGSVTQWIRGLKRGDSVAAQKTWERYCQRLVSLARARLRAARRRTEDEEDAALSAFDSFCRGAAHGRFTQLADREDLWQLLVVITARKAADQMEREARVKRGGGNVRGDSAVRGPADDDGLGGWDRFAGTEPTPDFAAQAAEEYGRLLRLLADDELRSIAVWKMEGCTNEEIAARLKASVPTVERRLRIIRKTWRKGLDQDEA